MGKGTEGGQYSRFFQRGLCPCGRFCAYIEVLCRSEREFCLFDHECGCLRFHLCNSSFHNRLVINISGQKLSEVVNCVDGLWHLKDPEATDVLGRVIQGWPRHCPTGKYSMAAVVNLT